MFTFYQGKPLSWSSYNVHAPILEKYFDTSIVKHISYNSLLDVTPTLSKFYQKNTNLFKYKQAVLSGDLAEQKSLLNEMDNFDLHLVLNAQSFLWANLCNTKNFSKEQVNLLATDPVMRGYIRQTFFDFENFFFSAGKVKNCHVIAGRQIAGFPMFFNASNLNTFHVSQELTLKKTNDFVLESPALFKNRVKQSFDKLGEFNQAINGEFKNTILIAPSQRSIRCDNYMVFLDDSDINSVVTKFNETCPLQTRFSLNEVFPVLSSYKYKVTSMDFTQGLQRYSFQSEEDLILFMTDIVINNKIKPLLEGKVISLSEEDYLIAAEFIFFKSNVASLQIDETIAYLNKSVNILKGSSNISLQLKVNIIDDPWNL